MNNDIQNLLDRMQFLLEKLYVPKELHIINERKNENDNKDDDISPELKDIRKEDKRRQQQSEYNRLKRKHNIQDFAQRHSKTVGITAAAGIGAAGIAYGIKKLKDRAKEKKRLQNLYTQKRLQRSNPNESYYYPDILEQMGRGSRAMRGFGLIGSVVGAGLGIHSLYKAFTSSGDVSGNIQSVANYADDLSPHIKKEIDGNIAKIHNIIPKKLIRDVMFTDNMSDSGVIIINNENELCRHFASRSYNNKTNEGIIFYVLELFKQKKMDYNIITYDFFTKYYQRSLTKALSDNESNENCYNCYNCKQCVLCIDCINCINCKYCINCTNCRILTNESDKRNITKSDNNNVIDNEAQQLAQYGITLQDIETQIGIIRRRQNKEKTIIRNLYRNKREQDIELAKLPTTAKEFKEKAIQELIEIKTKRRLN